MGDGAQILEKQVDVAVIAGMGGETIAHIVENANGRLDGTKLVVQPNVAAPELRRRLNASGWEITDETLVRDGRRIYVIIAAQQGRQALSDLQYEVGPVLLERKPALLADYTQFRLRVARKALLGAANGSDAAAAAAIRREIEIWEGIEACL